MAGIGVKLNNIFEKKSILANFIGAAYSTVITVAPMFVVIIDILFMGYVLGFDEVSYMERELFSCTVLYTFIFSLLAVSPFCAVLSKYVQDAIYEERYQDILPCFYLGLAMNLGLGCLASVPFCIWEYFVGGIKIHYVFTGFCTFLSLVMVLYSMIYLSICKDYQRISVYFLLGMATAFLMSLGLRFWCQWSIGFSMLFALMTGFFLTAALEFATIKRYFRQNSNRYKPVLQYFTKWWQLVAANFLYILGLYIHNFVFWTSDMRMVLVKSFVCNQPYDMATCIALFTNISATILFIARVEMHFHEKYKAYSEAVIGGKGVDIENAKRRMFRQLASELMALARVQFIISVVVYLACTVMLPQLGFAGLIMRIYPTLAAGYFILFLMYAAILFLYYFNDLAGALMTACSFCAVTFAGSMIAVHLPDIWYGVGLIAGAFTGWTVSYLRIRWVERHLASHVFCRGDLLKRENVPEPSGKVYDKYALPQEQQ